MYNNISPAIPKAIKNAVILMPCFVSVVIFVLFKQSEVVAGFETCTNTRCAFFRWCECDLLVPVFFQLAKRLFSASINAFSASATLLQIAISFLLILIRNFDCHWNSRMFA